MTYLIVGLVVAIALVILFRWWAKRPLRHRLNVAQGDYRRYLEALLNRGYDRGFMVIQAPDRKRFIQFSKYMKDAQVPGLQFDFPQAAWSQEYSERLKALLDQRNYKYEIQTVEPSPKDKSANAVSEFVVIDLQQDLKAAAELSKLVFLEVFKLNSSDTVALWFVNVSPWDEKIGFS